MNRAFRRYISVLFIISILPLPVAAQKALELNFTDGTADLRHFDRNDIYELKGTLHFYPQMLVEDIPSRRDEYVKVAIPGAWNTATDLQAVSYGT